MLAQADPGERLAELVGAVFGYLTVFLVLYQLIVRSPAIWRFRRDRVSATARRGDLRDVTPAARAIRRRGRWLLAAQWAGLNLFFVGLVPFVFGVGALRPLGGTAVALGLLLGFGATAWARRAGRPTPAVPASARMLLPRLARGFAPAALALAVLAIGVLLFVFALGGGGVLAVSPEAAPTDAPALEPVFAAMGLLGVVIFVVGLLLLRLARRQARMLAGELQRLDQRAPVLYLRSFVDDRLKVRAVPSGRKPLVEILAPRIYDRFEEVLDWELSAVGPVIAVGRPGKSVRSLGPARQPPFSNEEWQAGVSRRLAEAGLVVATLGRGEGFLWEVGEIARRERLDRTVFLVPPCAAGDLRQRWPVFADQIAAALGRTLEWPGDVVGALTVRVSKEGAVTATTADRRDEAAYRAALGVAVHEPPRAGDASAAAATGGGEPAEAQAPSVVRRGLGWPGIVALLCVSGFVITPVIYLTHGLVNGTQIPEESPWAQRALMALGLSIFASGFHFVVAILGALLSSTRRRQFLFAMGIMALVGFVGLVLIGVCGVAFVAVP